MSQTSGSVKTNTIDGEYYELGWYLLNQSKVNNISQLVFNFYHTPAVGVTMGPLEILVDGTVVYSAESGAHGG